MKNQTLSIEQMKHLKALGVDVSKASVVLLFIGEDGEHAGWEVENHGMTGAEPLHEWWNEESEVWESTHKEYFDAETGSYDHSYRGDCGVFTLQNMLEMMPNSIRINHLLKILKDKDSWMIGYFLLGENKFIYPIFSTPDILDAVYNMLCWLAENNYLNKKP